MVAQAPGGCGNDGFGLASFGWLHGGRCLVLWGLGDAIGFVWHFLLRECAGGLSAMFHRSVDSTVFGGLRCILERDVGNKGNIGRRFWLMEMEEATLQVQLA